MIIKIPLSVYREQAYDIIHDEMRPLRRWWVCNIKYRNTGIFREVVARFGVQYL
jgi:hypothetical protein